MNDAFMNGMKELLKAREELGKNLSSAAEQMVGASEEARRKFEAGRRKIREDIERGARLTNHRINL